MSNHILWYDTPAKYWTDALPLGNGSLGAMFFSGTNKDRIALNHDTLWTGYPRKITKDGAYDSYIRAQKLAADDKLEEAQKEIEDNFETCWSQAYLPLGDLYINFGMHFAKISHYKRSLDISNALLENSYKKNDNSIKREAFVSNPDNVLVYKIRSEKKIHFSVTFNCKLKSETFIENGIIVTDGICPSDSDSYSPKYPCNSLIYSEAPSEAGVSFRTAVKVVTDGKAEIKDDFISFSGVTKAVIYLSTATNFVDGLTAPAKSTKEYKNACIAYVNNASKKGYEKLKSAHEQDYKKYYDRVEFSLEKSNANSELPTDKRLLAFKNDKTDLELYELLYNFARYLMISSSRENTLATNLQGIWSENLKAPWNSNYTININTEMNYWPALACNLAEMTEPFAALMKTLSVTGEVTAKEYYHAGGFVAHHNADIWGYSVPTYGNAQWGFWSGGSGWLCHQLYEYYEYTLDENYLRTVALPIISKAAQFYLDILVEDKDGKLIISPGTSPENSFFVGEKAVSVAKTSTMLNTIVLDTLKNCRAGLEALGETHGVLYERIEAAIPKIKPFAIGSQGQLLEWEKEYKECEVHHRHVSHLIGLHPFNIINESETPELFNACKKTLEIRGDDGTGWSLAWKINFHARLKDGNHALKLLKMQLNPVRSHKKTNVNFGGGGGTFPNMFDAHPPFQIDGNFGAASGINEMLLQCDNENITLLPALPDEWSNGSIKGLCAKGNIAIDIAWHNGKVTDYKVHGEPGSRRITVK